MGGPGPPTLSRSREPALREPLDQSARPTPRGDRPLAHRAVLLDQLARASELPGATDLGRGRLELVEQAAQALACGPPLAAPEVRERALDPVAQRRPAILGDPPARRHGELLTGVMPADERRHQ